MPYKDQEMRRLKSNEYAKAWRARNPGRRSPSYGKQYGQITHEASAAHMTVYRAVKRGDLVRAEKCEHCGAQGFTEAAHHNYADPLDVAWLCRSCHRSDDAASPKGGRTRLAFERGLPNGQKTHCVHGHAFDEQNTVYLKDGSRRCRECTRTRSREWQRGYRERKAS